MLEVGAEQSPPAPNGASEVQRDGASGHDALRHELGRLERLITQAGQTPAAPFPAERPAATQAAAPMPEGTRWAALEHARAVFRLTPFERDVLLLALAPELAERFGDLLAQAQADPARRRPTIGFATRALAGSLDPDGAEAWLALAPNAHLERTGLLEIVGDGPRATRQLRIPEDFWPRLAGLPQPPPFPLYPAQGAALDALVLAPSTRSAAQGVLERLAQNGMHRSLLVLGGPDGSGRESLARAIASELGLRSLSVDAAELESPERRRALVREAAWNLAAVILRGPVPPALLEGSCVELSTLLIVISASSALQATSSRGPRAALALDVAPLAAPEREQLWQRLLGDRLRDPALSPRAVAARHRMGAGRIHALATALQALSEARGDGVVRATDLHAACAAAGSAPGSLATRLDCPHEEQDLVLPPSSRREIALISAWLRHAPDVFQPGGAAGRLRASGSFAALFSGPPGTGKTMAAQVLARAHGLPLLRIDLSQVVNKYVGETEKNLGRAFAEAEASGAVLFFDEADALFGKRTELRDAHDRYANLETAFLLQRLESHPGLVILATNLQNNIDAAFLRRIQVWATFPLPEPAERQLIWQRHLAADHLAPDVEPARLAALVSLSGGDIKNAVATAALLSACEGGKVHMRHLVIGVWRELQKTGRLVSPDDFGPWRADVLRYLQGDVAPPPSTT